MDAQTLYRWLKKNGYALRPKTRIEAHAHPDGAHPITYAETLLIEGPEDPPAEVMDAVRFNRDELLALTCVLFPPEEAPWLGELVRRYRTGYEHVWESRKGGDGKSPLVTGISLECLAANVAGFMGLHPREGIRFEPIIRAAFGGSPAGGGNPAKRGSAA